MREFFLRRARPAFTITGAKRRWLIRRERRALARAGSLMYRGLYVMFGGMVLLFVLAFLGAMEYVLVAQVAVAVASFYLGNATGRMEGKLDTIYGRGEGDGG